MALFFRFGRAVISDLGMLNGVNDFIALANQLNMLNLFINTMKLITPFSIPKSDMTALPKRKNKVISKKSN